MRKDVFSGRWVIMADTTTVRPSDFHFKRFVRETTFCPFCETNEASTPPEVFAIRHPDSHANSPGWSVRVVPHSNPRLRIEGELGRRAEGFHDLMNGIGAHEIVAETPRHDRSLHELEIHEICDVIRAYVARMVDLEGDKRMRYVLIFKNHGEEVGAHTISHSISQLMALSVTPRTVKTKLITARDYFGLKERCIYCDVLQQELREPLDFCDALADGCRASPHSSPRGMQRLSAVFRTSTACLLVWCNRFHDGVIWITRGTVICFVTPFFFWLEFCGPYWRLAPPARDPRRCLLKSLSWFFDDFTEVQ